jgi:segregation and condensation protein A
VNRSPGSAGGAVDGHGAAGSRRSPNRRNAGVPVPRERGNGFLLVELDRFQGPLDLLLHLIRQQDIDIFDIPIATITDQFLVAVTEIQAGDLDGAGEFLEMAATLIRIKAQMLLPRYAEEEEEDPRAELVRRLLEYEQIREISSRLVRAEAERARRFPKGYLEFRPRGFVEDTPLESTWEEVLEAASEVDFNHPRNRPHRVTTGMVALEEKVRLILAALETSARVKFSKLLAPWGNKEHGVVTLLAGLELSRQRALTLRQTRLFSELWLLRGDLEEWARTRAELVNGGAEREGEAQAGVVDGVALQLDVWAPDADQVATPGGPQDEGWATAPDEAVSPDEAPDSAGQESDSARATGQEDEP